MNTITKDNSTMLYIDNILSTNFKLLSNSVGEYENIIGIFYHELMCYLTNFYILKESNVDYKDDIKFPFLNTSYIKNPYEIIFTEIEKIKISKRDRILDFIASLSKGHKENFTVCRGDNGLSNIKLTQIIISSIFRLGLRIDSNKKCSIQKIDKQLFILSKAIEEVFSFLGVDNKDILTKNFINYAKMYITEIYIYPKGKYLVCGSMSILNNRINASNYKAQGKTVISLSHANSTFTHYDEPVVGYGELSYCDHYLDIGNQHDLLGLENISPLQKIPMIHYYSDSYTKKLYNIREILFRKVDHEVKICYIPTIFASANLYGPFRQFEDHEYLKWQKTIMNLNLNLKYIPHPSSNTCNVDMFWLDDANNDSRKIKDILIDYDIFFVDYSSSVLSYLAATDKPILFFDLGLRNMSNEYKEKLNERAFVYKIDIFGNLELQVSDAIKSYNKVKKDFVNNFTTSFSLHKNPNKNLTKIVKDIIL